MVAAAVAGFVDEDVVDDGVDAFELVAVFPDDIKACDNAFVNIELLIRPLLPNRSMPIDLFDEVVDDSVDVDGVAADEPCEISRTAIFDNEFNDAEPANASACDN